MRVRLIAPVLLVIALTGVAFALTRMEAERDAWLALAGGLALAAVTGLFAATTERRRRAMREVDRFFTLSPELVIVAGFDGYWKRINPTVEAVLGYSEREALARPFLEFVHPDDRERTVEEAQRVVGGETVFAFEIRMVCKDGSYRWIEWTATPVPEECVMYGVGRDITERRRSETEQTALQRIATLVAEAEPPQNLIAVVAEEVARVFDVPVVSVMRYDADDTATECATFSDGSVSPSSRRWPLDSTSVLRLVHSSRDVARIDDYSDLEGELAAVVRQAGLRSTVGAPIAVAGRIWGAMVVSRRDEPLPESTAVRLRAFTEILATAIANAEARAEVQRLADGQAALRRVATLVAEAAPAGELFAAVAEEVALVVGVPTVTLTRFEPDRSFTVVGCANNVGFPVGSRWPIDGPSLAGTILDTGRAARIDDYSNLPGTLAATMREASMHSSVGVPIVVDGRVWGHLSVSATDARPLPADAERRLYDFTELVGTAISKAESRDALRRLAEEQADLRRVATLVAQRAASDEVFWAVSDEVAGLFGTQLAAVGRFEPDGKSIDLVGAERTRERWELGDFLASAERLADEQAALRRVATLVAKEDSPAEVFAKVAEEAGSVLGNIDCVLWRDEGDGTATVVASSGEAISTGFPVGTRVPLDGDGVAASVLSNGQPHRIDDYSSVDDLVRQGAHERGIYSAVGCPIVVRGDIWGVIVVATVGGERCPPETERRLGQFADLVATAIANADARTEIERLADEQAALRRVATLVARDAPSTATWRAKAHRPHVTQASSRPSAHRSPSKAAFGVRSLRSRPARSRFPNGRRSAWVSSPSSSRPRSRTRRAEPSSPPRGGASSRRPTRRADRSSETSTTARNSASSRSGSRYAPPKRVFLPIGAIFAPSWRAWPTGWLMRWMICRRSRAESTRRSSRRAVLARRCERSRTAHLFP